MAALWKRPGYASRSSSTSSSRCILSPSAPDLDHVVGAHGDFGHLRRQTRGSSAFLTVSKSCGRQHLDAPSSCVNDVVGARLHATSMILSSLVPGAKISCAAMLELKGHRPSVPMLPPCLEKAWRTSPRCAPCCRSCIHDVGGRRDAVPRTDFLVMHAFTGCRALAMPVLDVFIGQLAALALSPATQPRVWCPGRRRPFVPRPDFRHHTVQTRWRFHPDAPCGAEFRPFAVTGHGPPLELINLQGAFYFSHRGHPRPSPF